jgi:hypothetical protein
MNLILLNKIRQYPNVYLSQPSVKLLASFIAGYQLAIYEQTGQPCYVVSPECTFEIGNIYNMHTSSVTTIALKLSDGNEEAAFYKFFELLDSYLLKKTK